MALIAAGARPDTRVGPQALTALMAIASEQPSQNRAAALTQQSQPVQVARALIAHGADVNARDNDGVTPRTIATRARAGSSGPVMVWVSAARTEHLFVGNERDNTVTVLDTKTLKTVAVIPVGQRPRGLIITPDHRQILICNGDSDDISVIGAARLTVVGMLHPGPEAQTRAISPGRTGGLCLQ